MKTEMAMYRCDSRDCDNQKLVSEANKMEPHDWLVVDAWVIGAGSGKQYFCPTCKPALLKALGR